MFTYWFFLVPLLLVCVPISGAGFLTSPTKMYHKVVGVYTHEKFESWGHTVTANVIAHGNMNMPHTFEFSALR